MSVVMYLIVTDTWEVFSVMDLSHCSVNAQVLPITIAVQVVALMNLARGMHGSAASQVWWWKYSACTFIVSVWLSLLIGTCRSQCESNFSSRIVLRSHLLKNSSNPYFVLQNIRIIPIRPVDPVLLVDPVPLNQVRQNMTLYDMQTGGHGKPN